ncbi:MAG: ACP phosphodiesterase [Akkermansiaceae bacterium]
MNYLAHLLLADNTDESRIGNLLGDFTRGAIFHLEKEYPAEVVRGIRMHRAVDRFTDDHKLFRQSRQLLAPERRRFAGIIVDIFFDHFLCLHWKDYHDEPIEEFIASIYRALDEHPEWRAGRLADVFPMMRDEDWLARYATVEGIENTLSGVSRRSPRVTKIAGGADDLRNNYETFESIFNKFMPDLLGFVKKWKLEN